MSDSAKHVPVAIRVVTTPFHESIDVPACSFAHSPTVQCYFAQVDDNQPDSAIGRLVDIKSFNQSVKLAAMDA